MKVLFAAWLMGNALDSLIVGHSWSKVFCQFYLHPWLIMLKSPLAMRNFVCFYYERYNHPQKPVFTTWCGLIIFSITVLTDRFYCKYKENILIIIVFLCQLAFCVRLLFLARLSSFLIAQRLINPLLFLHIN